jgi:hypothetical protein
MVCLPVVVGNVGGVAGVLQTDGMPDSDWRIAASSCRIASACTSRRSFSDEGAMLRSRARSPRMKSRMLSSRARAVLGSVPGGIAPPNSRLNVLSGCASG